MSVDILVIGAGMYTIGKHTEQYGTIFPTLVQAQANGLVGDIVISGKSADTRQRVQDKVEGLQKQTRLNPDVEVYPKESNNPVAYLEALDSLEDPAGVIISTPDHLHYKMAKEVIERGFPVQVVKPLTPNTETAIELVDLCREHGVYGTVEFHKRHDPANRILKRDLTDGSLGDPVQIYVEYSQKRSIPSEVFQSWIKETNIFQYLGPHYIDIIYWATGATPVRVVATGQKARLKHGGIDTYDAIQANVEWSLPDGHTFSSTLLTSWIDPIDTPAMSDQLIKVWGTEGRMFSDQKDRGIEKVTDQKGVETINPLFSQYLPDSEGKLRIEGYGPKSIQSFIEDVRKLAVGKVDRSELIQSRPTFRDGIVSTSVVEGVNKSLQTNSNWVELKNSSPY